jgi:uncharacterized membrane-anchored protein
MRLASTTLRAAGIIAIICALVASLVLWILLTDPVAVATAVNDGNLGAILSSLARTLGDAVRVLLRYL